MPEKQSGKDDPKKQRGEYLLKMQVRLKAEEVGFG